MSDASQSDLDALNKAIFQGVTKVKYSDKEITYRSLDEMIRISNLMKQDLGLVDRGPRRMHTQFRKGFD